MHTGDLATMDADGYVNIVGRIKDMVIRGGENVYPREVEEFLYGHPDIVDVQVIGVPDVKYGEELMAWVRLREGAAPMTAADVRAYCTGRIAHFKIPRYVHVTDEFPMTVTGKVQKYQHARGVDPPPRARGRGERRHRLSSRPGRYATVPGRHGRARSSSALRSQAVFGVLPVVDHSEHDQDGHDAGGDEGPDGGDAGDHARPSTRRRPTGAGRGASRP